MNKPSQYSKTFLTAFTLGLLFAASPAVASVTSYSNDTSGITCTLEKGILLKRKRFSYVSNGD
jgi:hypothetical protein